VVRYTKNSVEAKKLGRSQLRRRASPAATSRDFRRG